MQQAAAPPRLLWPSPTQPTAPEPPPRRWQAQQPQQPGPTQPAPVQPGAAQQRRTRAYDEPAADPGGPLACRNCHAGNEASRKFCRRCGAPLVHADLERLTWWQRFLRWLRGVFTRKPRSAGYRPRQRAAVRPSTVVLTGLLAVGLVVGFTPPLRERIVGGVVGGYNAIRDRMSKPVLVASRAPKASGSAKGAEPQFVNDAGNDTYWAPAKTAPATGEWVEVELEKPARVVSIIITSGASVDRPKFLTQARPHDLDVTLRAKNGKTTTTPIVLADTVGAQKFVVKGSDVKVIRLTIRTVYGGEPGRQVAVAELEIFVRS